ncbi:TonB-dependent receptor [Parasphingorhabdus sp.]|uniref:TonB-dependent receptor n=1 Tax=Parasphingorhabdus sp. TaxID=2709688 RepID=UPI002F91E014
MKPKTLTALTSMFVIAWTSAAYAQITTPAPAAEQAAAGDDNEIDGSEIIVTAQRRSERLVDVPVSVTAISADQILQAGPTSLENLTKVTPGVYLQRAVYGLSPTIRGIGSTLSASGGEQNVALYIDEIYYPTPTGNVFDLASVAGVEILKGPQGTLFGRNATGGAILVRTLDPSFDTSGRFNVSWERFNQVRASAYLNLPVSDKIAINGSVAYRYSQGYVRDLRTNRILNQGNNFTARGKILLQPTDNFSLILTAAHADFDDPSGADTRNFQPAPILTAVLAGGPFATDRYHGSNNTMQSIRTSTNEYSARARLETDMGTFSSFTSLLRNDLQAVNELDLGYANQSLTLRVETKTFSQEVNFASDSDKPLSFVTGAYYFRNRAKVPFLTSNGAALSNSEGRMDAIAGYLDGTYKFGDLSLIAGIRYSHEKRATDSAFGVSAPSPFTRFQRATDSQWTPRVGLKYELAPQTNIYATYSKGFKSGVFDATTADGPGVKPETVDAFELGFKTASRDISFNIAAFYYDYLNTQVNATVSGANGAVFNQLFNVPKSRIYGIDADLSWRINDNFDLRMAAAYTHARYVDFQNAPGYVNDPTNPTSIVSLPIGPGGSLVPIPGLLFANVVVNASGNNMVRSPEFTASSTLSYHTSVGGNNELELTVSPYYSSRVYFTFDNSLSQKAYVTLDAAATLTLDENMKISVFGRNLTDGKYFINKSQNALSLEAGRYAEPRTYGVSLGYSF